MTHIDDFIDDPDTDKDASWFFLMHRLPASLQFKFSDRLSKLKLFCTYKDNYRYRVTGCSRMGDVWLTVDFEQSTGYQKRVDVADCRDFLMKSQPTSPER